MSSVRADKLLAASESPSAVRAGRLPSLRWGVVVFPGTNCDLDTLHVLGELLGQEARPVWHRETDLAGLDAVILPGGFAHGDYLRAGAVARFSPVMEAVREFAEAGKPVLGICNGFQVLLEAGLLPGAMLRNRSQNFMCRWVHLRVEHPGPPFLSGCAPGEILRMPVAHGEGNYYADAETLARLNARGQVLLRYCSPDGEVAPAGPNGSVESIAGIASERGNVMGLMPHPERACEPLLGSGDGRKLFESVIRSFA
jgi:phosphoribosylformylglycinamidine synthase subunit PurQ / glutaminase